MKKARLESTNMMGAGPGDDDQRGKALAALDRFQETNK